MHPRVTARTSHQLPLRRVKLHGDDQGCIKVSFLRRFRVKSHHDSTIYEVLFGPKNNDKRDAFSLNRSIILWKITDMKTDIKTLLKPQNLIFISNVEYFSHGFVVGYKNKSTYFL